MNEEKVRKGKPAMTASRQAQGGGSKRAALGAGRFSSHVAFCLALLWLADCGRKTPVKAPELVAPEAITDLTAHNRDDGVHLTWGRPRNYADGAVMWDLSGFRVERSSGAAPFELLATLEVTDRYRFRQVRRFSFTDVDAIVQNSYRYRVLAFTLAGHMSEPSNVVEIVRGAQPSETPQSELTPASQHEE